MLFYTEIDELEPLNQPHFPSISPSSCPNSTGSLELCWPIHRLLISPLTKRKGDSLSPFPTTNKNNFFFKLNSEIIHWDVIINRGRWPDLLVCMGTWGRLVSEWDWSALKRSLRWCQRPHNNRASRFYIQPNPFENLWPEYLLVSLSWWAYLLHHLWP